MQNQWVGRLGAGPGAAPSATDVTARSQTALLADSGFGWNLQAIEI